MVAGVVDVAVAVVDVGSVDIIVLVLIVWSSLGSAGSN